MSSGDPFAARNNILREVIADSVGDSPDRSSAGRKPFGSGVTAKPEDETLAEIEQFEKVWKMPDDDEEESGFLTTTPGSLDSFSPKPGQEKFVPNLNQQRSIASLSSVPKENQPSSTQPSGMTDLERKEKELNERDARILEKGIGLMLGEEDTIREESDNDDEDPAIKRKDMREINRMIKLGNLADLESKAELLAKTWKAKLGNPAIASTETSHDFGTIDPEMTIEEETTIEEELVATDSSTKNQPMDFSQEEVTTKTKGESPKNVDSKNMPSDAINLEESRSVGVSPTPKKASVSFDGTADEEKPSNSGGAYIVGDWFARGDVATVLADFSDSSSFSSHTGSAFSTSSMDATTRASSLDTPFANELDDLVARKDWDGVSLAAQNFESLQGIERTVSGSNSIEEKKRRKRELEATWKASVSNAFASGSKHQLN